MTGRSALGRAYLDHLAGSPSDADPTAGLRTMTELLTAYGNQFLSAPLFLGEDERRSVTGDLYEFYAVLLSLPERLFGGDVSALARTVGMTAGQTAVVFDSAVAGQLPPLGRADLFHDGDRFRLLELNVSSALGGLYNSDINRAMLAHPPLREFVTRHGLRYQDTTAAVVRTLLAQAVTALPADRPPTVAVVDTEENFRIAGDRLRLVASRLGEHGVTAIACHLGELTYPSGRPSAGGRAIDIVMRYFLIEDLDDPATVALVRPLVAAARRERVTMVSRIDGEVYGNKGTLALLSAHQDRDLFTARERACVDRLLPWTRLVRPRVTDPGGTVVDLLTYARAHQNDLVLKPTLLHGGAGVVAGWRAGPERWAAEVASAMGGPHVLQQRIRPVGEPGPVYPNWGIYFAGAHDDPADGYAGCLVRAGADPDVGVLSLADGALLGCAFHGSLREDSP